MPIGIDMDRHIRWLRRYVLWRVSVRLALESATVAIAVVAVYLVGAIGPGGLTLPGLGTTGLGWPAAMVIAIAVVQLFAITRLALALATGSVNVRYLLAWDKSASAVTTLPNIGATARQDAERTHAMDAVGFHYLAALARPGKQQAAFEVYTIDSGLVMLCASHDEPTIALSQLSTGTLLLTTTEVVPPSTGLLVNLVTAEDAASKGAGPLTFLVSEHRHAIGRLQAAGVEALVTTAAVVGEYLDREWDAWDQLGPFVGSLVRVEPGTRPFALEVVPPLGQLHDRIMSSITITPTVSAPVERRRAVRYAPGAPPAWTTRTHRTDLPTADPTPAAQAAQAAGAQQPHANQDTPDVAAPTPPAERAAPGL